MYLAELRIGRLWVTHKAVHYQVVKLVPEEIWFMSHYTNLNQAFYVKIFSIQT